jgi:hypothetical protein
MVHLYELVEVYGQHFESYHKMLSEIELVHATNNVLLVLRVLVIKVFNQFRFHKALFVQSFLILQNLEGTVLSLLVVVAFEYDAKTAFTDFLDYLISISQVFINLA